jgi:LPS-assembly lipoprotein
MSSPERTGAKLRTALALTVAVALAGAAGCTVRPLYSTPQATSAIAPGAVSLASIAVKPVETRYAQEVRNHLIFLLNGGVAPATVPTYSLDIGVTTQSRTTAVIQRALDDEPTAGAVVMISLYRLTDNATGRVISAGRRETTASYDRPRQEFAVLRAERDAQNRAARELAELIRLALVQDLDRLSK